MKDPDKTRVERDLLRSCRFHGILLCPICGEQLRPWGMACKRKLRHGPKDVELQPRRSRCRGCLRTRTQVLLPAVCLLRRRDLAEVIGRALVQRARMPATPDRSRIRGALLYCQRLAVPVCRPDRVDPWPLHQAGSPGWQSSWAFWQQRSCRQPNRLPIPGSDPLRPPRCAQPSWSIRSVAVCKLGQRGVADQHQFASAQADVDGAGSFLLPQA